MDQTSIKTKTKHEQKLKTLKIVIVENIIHLSLLFISSFEFLCTLYILTNLYELLISIYF